ncbi:MAG: hypothetical protein OXT70_01040 [Chloroflexota bacterium]|nr:hypothetical protein [Chloroflexota bacterium]
MSLYGYVPYSDHDFEVGSLMDDAADEEEEAFREYLRRVEHMEAGTPAPW